MMTDSQWSLHLSSFCIQVSRVASFVGCHQLTLRRPTLTGQAPPERLIDPGPLVDAFQIVGYLRTDNCSFSLISCRGTGFKRF